MNWFYLPYICKTYCVAKAVTCSVHEDGFKPVLLFLPWIFSLFFKQKYPFFHFLWSKKELVLCIFYIGRYKKHKAFVKSQISILKRNHALNILRDKGAAYHSGIGTKLMWITSTYKEAKIILQSLKTDKLAMSSILIASWRSYYYFKVFSNSMWHVYLHQSKLVLHE